MFCNFACTCSMWAILLIALCTCMHWYIVCYRGYYIIRLYNKLMLLQNLIIILLLRVVTILYKYPYLSNVNSFSLEVRDIWNVRNEKLRENWLCCIFKFFSKIKFLRLWCLTALNSATESLIGSKQKWKYTPSAGYKNSFTVLYSKRVIFPN